MFWLMKGPETRISSWSIQRCVNQWDGVKTRMRFWFFLSGAWVNFLLNSRIGLMLKSVKNTILSLCSFWYRIIFSFLYLKTSSTSSNSFSVVCCAQDTLTGTSEYGKRKCVWKLRKRSKNLSRRSSRERQLDVT